MDAIEGKDITGYEWSTSDNQTKSGSSVEFEFEQQCTHTITLKTICSSGKEDFTTKNIEVITPEAVLKDFLKNGIGKNRLSLDEMPIKHAKMCMSETIFTNGTLIPSDITIVIDSETEPTIFEMEFTISEVIDTEEDRMLYLVTGTHTSPSPEIITHPEGPVLGIALSEIDILGFYRIPKVISRPQPVSIVGQALPFLVSKITVNVNFDEHKIAKLMSNNEGVIYVQAGLIKVSELEQGIFENMILSEMDTINLVANECPEEIDSVIEADNLGNQSYCKSPNNCD